MESKIVVCINTYNEGPELARTVGNFQAKGADKVVIFADGTTDDSYEVFRDAEDVLVLINSQRIGIGEAKYQATEQALYDDPSFIFYTDAHARISVGDLRLAAAFAKEHSPCIVTPIVCPLNCVRATTEPRCSRHGSASCTASCPDIADDLSLSPNGYIGGGFRMEKDGKFALAVDLKAGPNSLPKDRTFSSSNAVNFSAFGFTPETYELLGGWNRYPGWWGSQELGVSLRAWFVGIPIYLLHSFVVHHRYRSWNHPEGKAISDYPIPDGHTEANERYALSVVFEPETMEKVWNPFLKRFRNDAGKELCEKSPHLDEQRELFQTKRLATPRGEQRDQVFFRTFFGNSPLLSNPLSGARVRPEATRALYALGGGIGDAVLAVPAMKALAAHSGAPIHVYASPDSSRMTALKVLLENQPFIHQVISEIEDPRLYRFFCDSYWGRIPIPFLPEGCSFAGARRAWRTRHETECNMEAVRSLGYRGPTPTVRFTALPRVEVNPPLRGTFVAIGVGTSGQEMKRYPYWRYVAEQLQRDGDAELVFLGRLDESKPWMEIVGSDLCGKTELDGAAAILHRASLYVGVDNGLSHLAAAVGTPTLLLYGPSTERKNLPWSSGCQVIRSTTYGCGPCWDHPKRKRCKFKKSDARPCMKSIDPAYVALRIRRALEHPFAAHSEHGTMMGLSVRQRIVNEGVVLLQDGEELVRLGELLGSHPIRTVLEIGSADGGWLYFMAMVLGPGLRLISVDPSPEKPIREGESKFRLVKGKIKSLGNTFFHIPIESSKALEDPLARTTFAAQQVDLLHIDGWHGLRQVVEDYENYESLVRPGGLIVFHDIANPYLDAPGPGIVWGTLKKDKRLRLLQSFIHTKGEKPRGIGVAQKQQLVFEDHNYDPTA